MPVVSILTAAYNNGKYIEEMIKSVLSQTFQNWELIIVDDGSTDDTKKKIEPYLVDNRINYIWQTNKGQAAARNKAYLHSKGKFIAILDSDDYWVSSKLEKQVKILKFQPEIGLIYTDVIEVNDKSKKLKKRHGVKDISGDPIKTLLIKNNPIGFSSVLINRNYLDPENIQEDSIKYADEVITLYRLAFRAKNFKYISEPLTFYRIHKRSLHFTENVKDYKLGRLQAIDLFFKEPNLPKRILMLKRKAYARVFFSVVLRYNELRRNPFESLWHIFLTFLHDPTRTVKLIRQVIRIIYLHLVLPFSGKLPKSTV